MNIIKNAVAGTLESSDVYVEICPEESGNIIEIESVVGNQFKDEILETVEQVLKDLDVKNAKIRLSDRGALDCVIRARVETAIFRAREVE